MNTYRVRTPKYHPFTGLPIEEYELESDTLTQRPRVEIVEIVKPAQIVRVYECRTVEVPVRYCKRCSRSNLARRLHHERVHKLYDVISKYRRLYKHERQQNRVERVRRYAVETRRREYRLARNQIRDLMNE